MHQTVKDAASARLTLGAVRRSGGRRPGGARKTVSPALAIQERSARDRLGSYDFPKRI
jgi:hypothetical protein